MISPIADAEQPRVLYMEDDGALAELAHRRLERQGWVVETAADGLAGLEKLRHATFDVVVVDYKMPRLDGLGVLKRMLAEHPASPPVVMVSGFGSMEIAIEAMRLGAVDYVVKESGGNYPALLLGTIERVLEKRNLIRDKKRAEAALRESELQLRSIADSASEVIVSADADGCCTFWNHGAESIFGYREDEILGRSLTALIPENDRALHSEALGRVNRTGEMRRAGQLLEVTAQRKNGERFPLELSLSSWAVDGRRFFSAVGREITARKQEERRAQRLFQTQVLINTLLRSATATHPLERQLEIALNLILTESWLPTLGKGVLFLHDETGDRLLLTIQQGMEALPLQTCARVARNHCLCGRVLAEKRIRFVTQEEPELLTCGAGEARSSVCCVPILSHERVLGVMTLHLAADHAGNAEEEDFLHAVANTLAGIIERKQLDEKLQQAIADADRANAEKSRFLAAMSHEIRTPMNAILGMGEILAESRLDEEQRRHV
ncbi:MAG: PAS domain S-box protein, partial [Magnetococcales bacterium]|nr:PAS domain S-box protein [Magnetococcales bacterium]